MRLLFVIDHFGSGGAQRQMVNLALGLRHRGHSVDFFVYYPEFRFFRAVLDKAGIAVFEVRKRGRVGLGVVRALRRLMASGRYAAVVAFMETPGVYAELAHMGLRATPLIVSERVDPPAGPSGAGLRCRALLHRLADCVVANSHACRLDWARRFPSLAGRLETIWNGVDLSRFSPGDTSRGFAEQLSVLAVGTLVPRKNAHGVIEALREIKRRNGVVPKVTWIGKVEETEEGRRYRSELEDRVRCAGLDDRWEWAGEQLGVEDAMRRADLLVHASHREGLSNVICEALASGCPVLAADVGDNRLLIGNQERGALFDPSDPGALADRFQEFSRLPAVERQRLSASARAFAERELGLDRCVARYEALIHSTVGAS